MIVVPYVRGQLRPETRSAVGGAAPLAYFHEIDRDDPYAYADFLRQLWRAMCDVIVVEQDVVPPPGAIGRLRGCSSLWCTHPHWVATKFVTDSLGLARFSWQLKVQLPDLADWALAPHDGRAWTRRGLTNVPADCNQATLDRHGARATLRPDVQLPVDRFGRRIYPSSVTWRTCDSALSRQLRHHGIYPHVHPGHTAHLHEY